MRVQHVVVTPFCIRNPQRLHEARGGVWNLDRDPLEPDFLDRRLRLMEMIAAPSVRGQTGDRFSWVILVDPDLEPSARDRLRAICGDEVEVLIRPYDPSDRVESTHWLQEYSDRAPDYVITTHLDDDDAFPRTYVEDLRASAECFIADEGISISRVFGCKKNWGWNLVKTRGSPLGTRCDWPNPDYVASCGFSLLAKYPEFPVGVLGVRHMRAENYLDFASNPADDAVSRFRDRLREALRSVGVRPEEHSLRLGFEELGGKVGHTITSNHTLNDQFHRLFQRELNRVNVLGPETFPMHTLDWDAVERHMPDLRPAPRDMLRIGFQRLYDRMTSRRARGE